MPTPVGIPVDAVESTQIASVDIAVDDTVVDVNVVEAGTDVCAVAPVHPRA
jgi:hypothetical protein